jgi:transposase-like protein
MSCASAAFALCSRAAARSPTSPVISGSTRETLRLWVRQAEADHGLRQDRLTTQERERLRALEKENRELKRANEILKAASSYFAAELDPTRPKR